MAEEQVLVPQDDAEKSELAEYMLSVMILGQNAYTDAILQQYEMVSLDRLRLQRRVAELESGLPEYRTELDSAKARLTEIEDQLLRVGQGNVKLNGQIDNLKQGISDRDVRIEALLGDVNNILRQRNAAQDEVAQVREEYNLLNSQKGALTQAVSQCEAELKRKNEKIQQVLVQLDQVGKDLQVARHDYAVLQQSYYVCVAERDTAKRNLVEMQAERDRANGEVGLLTGEVKSARINREQAEKFSNSEIEKLKNLIYMYRQTHPADCQCDMCAWAVEYDIVHDEAAKAQASSSVKLPDA